MICMPRVGRRCPSCGSSSTVAGSLCSCYLLLVAALVTVTACVDPDSMAMLALFAALATTRLRTAPMDAHAAAASEYRAQAASEHFTAAAGDQFVPVIGDGLHAPKNRTGAQVRRQRKLVLLNAQWRGGSTLAEQLIFSTTIAPPFLLDEPAKAMWLDDNNHKISTVNFDALRCDFSKFNHTLLLNWQHWRGEFTRQRKLLNYRTFEEMRRRCFSAGNGGHVRAVKTIRMSGELDILSKNCMRERTVGNYRYFFLHHSRIHVHGLMHSARWPPHAIPYCQRQCVLPSTSLKDSPLAASGPAVLLCAALAALCVDARV